MWREWDIQLDANWWVSLGFHIDHTDPGITFHFPGFIIAIGRLKQPGFRYSLHRKHIDALLRLGGYNPDEVGHNIAELAKRLIEDVKESMKPQIAGPFVRGGKWYFDVRCEKCNSLVSHLAIYEDDLPNISDEQYKRWFEYSFLDGVRMGPSMDLLEVNRD